MDIRQRNASSMKEFVGVTLAMLEERRHEVALGITMLICIAAVWVMLLVWTQ